MNQNLSQDNDASLESLTDEDLESVCGGDRWGEETQCKADYVAVGPFCVPRWY